MTCTWNSASQFVVWVMLTNVLPVDLHACWLFDHYLVKGRHWVTFMCLATKWHNKEIGFKLRELSKAWHFVTRVSTACFLIVTIKTVTLSTCTLYNQSGRQNVLKAVVTCKCILNSYSLRVVCFQPKVTIRSVLLRSWLVCDFIPIFQKMYSIFAIWFPICIMCANVY